MLRDSGPAYYAMDSAHYRDYPNAMIWNDVQENASSGSWRSTPPQGRDESLPSGSSCQTYSEMQMYAGEPLSSFAQMMKEEDERFYATFPDARPHASTRKWLPSTTACEYSQTYLYSANEGASESSSTRVHDACGVPTRYDPRTSYVSVSVQNRADVGVSGYQDAQMADAYDPQLPDVNHRRHPSCDRTPSLAPLRTSQSSSASSPMIFTPHRLDPGLARATSQSPCPDDISHTSRARNILAATNLSLELVSHNENRLVCELDDPESDYASPAESIYAPGIPRIPSLSTPDTGFNSPSKSDDNKEGNDTCFTSANGTWPRLCVRTHANCSPLPTDDKNLSTSHESSFRVDEKLDAAASKRQPAATLKAIKQPVKALPAHKRAVGKKPSLACLFCRGRKIACGPPLAGSTDKTCNQCQRRSLKCEFPRESRRGMRKKKAESTESTTASSIPAEEPHAKA
ncbi:hypothetical protein IW261DRAFT_489307 [Armillaria novae-zelandiae]|uniref:Zn(2)-C6 fungal-type domain-containing protein n=1 Tax=Armillaria novae-zelandiae TaxID=153914 RepID=A0AA39UEE4_9AGAR|nr:hypothetical protein IW261DRAFT_489307 [Armillaria novae-zelandiae]